MIKEFYEYLLKGATKEQLVTYVEKLQAENEELKAQLDKATTAPTTAPEETYHDHGGKKSTVINPITKEPLYHLVDGKIKPLTEQPVSSCETSKESFYVNGQPVSKEAYEAAQERFKDTFKASPLIPFF